MKACRRIPFCPSGLPRHTARSSRCVIDQDRSGVGADIGYPAFRRHSDRPPRAGTDCRFPGKTVRRLKCPIAISQKHQHRVVAIATALGARNHHIRYCITVKVADRNRCRILLGVMVLRWLEGPVAAAEQQREAVRKQICHHHILKSISIEVGDCKRPRVVPHDEALLC